MNKEELEMSSVIMHQEKQVARPLKVLEALIKDDLSKANVAAEKAAAPFHEAAAVKFAEARSVADIERLLHAPSARRTDFSYPRWTLRAPIRF